MLWFLISWVVYGLFVGLIAKAIHPGDDPTGLLPTIGIGVIGSFVGGTINYLMGWGTTIFAPSGIFMGILGAIVFLFIYKKFLQPNLN